MSEKITAADFETVCVLRALSAGSCTAEELLDRLGLSRTLDKCIDEMLEMLHGRGLLVRSEDRVLLSERGRVLARPQPAKGQ